MKRKALKEEMKVFPALKKFSAMSLSNPTSKKRKKRQGGYQGLIGGENAVTTMTAGNFVPKLRSDTSDPYCMCLISPKTTMCRIPDSFTKCSALVRSVQSFDITANFDGSQNAGRYSATFQPIIGDVSELSHWQNLIVGNEAWPADFTLETNWTNTISGQDPALDQFFPNLVLPSLGQVMLAGSGGTGIYGPNPATVEAGTFSLPYQTSTATNIDTFVLDPGLYSIASNITYPGTIITSNYTRFNVDDVTKATLQQVQDILTPLSTPVAGQQSMWILNVTATGGGFTITNNSGVVGNNNNFLLISRMYSPDFPVDLNQGLVQQIRPVAMSVLCTNILSDFNAGGNVSIAYLPGETLTKNVLTLNAPFNLTCFENFENINRVTGNYNGNHKNGAYAWWAPTDQDDMNFYSINDSNDHDYPIIVVSGQVAAFSGSSGITPVARVEVVRVFEVMTNSLFLESECHTGSQGAIDKVNNCLNASPHCMANNDHLAWIRKVRDSIMRLMSRGADFYSQNSGWIDPSLRAAGSALLAL